MTDISGGHLVARALKAEGVEAIFTQWHDASDDIHIACLSSLSRRGDNTARRCKT